MKKKSKSKTSVKKAETSFFSKIYPLVIICVLGIIIYSNSFDCSFVFDDIDNITNNPAIHNIHDVKAIWGYLNRRFIGNITFALNYHYHNLEVFGYHLVNLLIHITASLLVWWFVLLVFSTPEIRKERISTYKRSIALGCAMLFISHPLQTQAVTYIVQRFASLAAMFYLASLCFYIKGRLLHNRVRYIFFAGSILTGLLGILTKENVITLPFAVLLCEIYFFSGGIKAFLIIFKRKKYIAYTLPFVLFILIIPYLLSFNFSNYFSAVPSQRNLDPPLTSSIYLMTQFRVIVSYIRLLIFPVHQNVDYDFPASRSFFELKTVSSFLFLVSLVLLALFIFKRCRLVSFGILWFFLALSVESSVKPLGNVIFEHRLYLPMVGYGIVLVITLFYLFLDRSSKVGISLFLVIIGINSFLAFERNKVWKDNISLWSDAAKKSPDKMRPHNNLGIALAKNGKIEEAVSEYRKALSIYPNEFNIQFNLGTALHNLGKIDEAISELQKAITINPNFFDGYYNLGNIFFKLGKYEEAVSNYRKALSINSQHLDSYCNLGNALLNQQKVDEAITEYNKALSIKPDYETAHSGIALCYLVKGNIEEYNAHLFEAQKLKKKFPR